MFDKQTKLSPRRVATHTKKSIAMATLTNTKTYTHTRTHTSQGTARTMPRRASPPSDEDTASRSESISVSETDSDEEERKKLQEKIRRLKKKQERLDKKGKKKSKRQEPKKERRERTRKKAQKEESEEEATDSSTNSRERTRKRNNNNNERSYDPLADNTIIATQKHIKTYNSFNLTKLAGAWNKSHDNCIPMTERIGKDGKDFRVVDLDDITASKNLRSLLALAQRHRKDSKLGGVVCIPRGLLDSLAEIRDTVEDEYQDKPKTLKKFREGLDRLEEEIDDVREALGKRAADDRKYRLAVHACGSKAMIKASKEAEKRERAIHKFQESDQESEQEERDQDEEEEEPEPLKSKRQKSTTKPKAKSGGDTPAKKLTTPRKSPRFKAQTPQATIGSEKKRSRGTRSQ